jgi:hypothetical protein
MDGHPGIDANLAHQVVQAASIRQPCRAQCGTLSLGHANAVSAGCCLDGATVPRCSPAPLLAAPVAALTVSDMADTAPVTVCVRVNAANRVPREGARSGQDKAQGHALPLPL